MGFPNGSASKEYTYNAGDRSSIPGSGRFPGEGNGNPFQHSWLKNPMDGGTWWATAHLGRQQSDTTEWLRAHLEKLKWKSLSCVQFFGNPMDCSPPGSSLHGISQARILEWVAISSPRGSSQIRKSALTGSSLPLSHQESPILSIGRWNKKMMVMLNSTLSLVVKASMW